MGKKTGTYTGSDGVERQLSDMVYRHLNNTANKLRRTGADPDKLAEIEEEMAKRPAPDAPIEDIVARADPSLAGKHMARLAQQGFSDPVTATKDEAFISGAADVDSAVESALNGEVRGIGDNMPPPFAVLLAERMAPLKNRVEKALVDAALIPPEIKLASDHDKAVSVGVTFAALQAETIKSHKATKEPLAAIVTEVDGFFLTRGLMGRMTPVIQRLARADGLYLDAIAEAARMEQKRLADAHQAEADARMGQAAEAEGQGQHSVAEVREASALAHEDQAIRHEQAAAAPQRTLARTTGVAGTAVADQNLEWDLDRATVDLEALRSYIPLEAFDAAIRAMNKADGVKKGAIPTRTLKGVVWKLASKSRFGR